MLTNSQIVDKTIMEADQDRDGKISFEEFTKMVENTDVSMSMTLGKAFPSNVVYPKHWKVCCCKVYVTATPQFLVNL